MNGLSLSDRNTLGALLDQQSQAEVMAMIPQFSAAETDNFVPAPAEVPDPGVPPGLPGHPALRPDPGQRAGRRLLPLRQQKHCPGVGQSLRPQLRLGPGVH